MDAHDAKPEMEHHKMTKGSYAKLAIELLIDAVIMYLVMYTMIDRLEHFNNNINQVYMVMMMVAPMGILMLIMMRSMFPKKRLNAILMAVFALIFILGFWFMRDQTAVGNQQFLRSMIPHHSGAILMCTEAVLTDPEILTLCEEIVQAQEEEIAQMEAILARYAAE